MSTSLIEMLDRVDALTDAVRLRSRTYELLALPDGAPVVDVGCGSGRSVAELAARGARPTGVDVNPEMIAAAKSRWPENAADFHIGDACDLPVSDVLGYRADKVLHELPEPARAVAEARRVLAPGGRIVLLGQDWDLIAIDSDNPEFTRGIVHERADALPSPRAARRYRNLLLDNGFRDVMIEVHTAVFTDERMLPFVSGFTDDRDWLAEQAERARAGRFFAAVPMFLASATR